MKTHCTTGKRSYPTQTMAEDALIGLWAKNDYSPSQGPRNVYRCDECGQFHMTSRGDLNERLSQYLSSDKSRIDREAGKWLDRLKHK